MLNISKKNWYRKEKHKRDKKRHSIDVLSIFHFYPNIQVEILTKNSNFCRFLCSIFPLLILLFQKIIKKCQLCTWQSSHLTHLCHVYHDDNEEQSNGNEKDIKEDKLCRPWYQNVLSLCVHFSSWHVDEIYVTIWRWMLNEGEIINKSCVYRLLKVNTEMIWNRYFWENLFERNLIIKSIGHFFRLFIIKLIHFRSHLKITLL